MSVVKAIFSDIDLIGIFMKCKKVCIRRVSNLRIRIKIKIFRYLSDSGE